MPKKRPGVILTDMQRRFCHEYVTDLKATHAATRAGYSKESARSTASHLLDKPEIQEYIEKLEENQFLALNIKAEDVKAELIRIGFSTIEDFEGFDIKEDKSGEEVESASRQEQDKTIPESLSVRQPGEGENKRNSVELGKGAETVPSKAASNTAAKEKAMAKLRNSKAVLSYRRVIVDPETGSRTTITFSLHHKLMALRILAQHFGLFAKDKAKYQEEVKVIFPKGQAGW